LEEGDELQTSRGQVSSRGLADGTNQSWNKIG
jgi:hypothetical protein